MINELKAEFRKVFSIRSTYIIFGLMLALTIFFGFYVGGWHMDKVDLLDTHHLYRITQQAINFLSVFMAIIAILLLTHEFRYNTVAYSLTLSNNRSKVLAAKIIVITILALVVTAIVGCLSPLLARWGAEANNLKEIHQQFYFATIAWKGLFYGWGYSMAGLVLALIIRNQIGAIVTLLLFPTTVEGLLSIWLKHNTDYLPFSALHTTLGVGETVNLSTISSERAAIVFLCYLVVGWIVGWYLFLTRDAI